MITQELKRIFNKGVKGEISQAIKDYLKSVDYYKKPPYQKSLQPQEDIIETAEKIFNEPAVEKTGDPVIDEILNRPSEPMPF